MSARDDILADKCSCRIKTRSAGDTSFPSQAFSEVAHEVTDEAVCIEAVSERAATEALESNVLDAFDRSAPGWWPTCLAEGKLSEEDREEIRRLLDASGTTQD
jgi:hypothetical protein